MVTFIKLRKYALSQNPTNEQIADLRKLLMLHNDQKFSEHDKSIRQIVHALNNLIKKPRETKPIGFRSN